LAVWKSSSPLDNGTLYGLALEKIPEIRDTYRRIGVAYVTTASCPTVNKILSFRRGIPRTEFPNMDYKEAAGSSGEDWEWRTIKIV
jgi:hypothetical protein